MQPSFRPSATTQAIAHLRLPHPSVPHQTTDSSDSIFLVFEVSGSVGYRRRVGKRKRTVSTLSGVPVFAQSLRDDANQRRPLIQMSINRRSHEIFSPLCRAAASGEGGSANNQS